MKKSDGDFSPSQSPFSKRTDPSLPPSQRVKSLLVDYFEPLGFNLNSRNVFVQKFELGRRQISLSFVNSFACSIGSISHQTIMPKIEGLKKKIFQDRGWTTHDLYMGKVEEYDMYDYDKLMHTEEKIQTAAAEVIRCYEEVFAKRFQLYSSYESLETLLNKDPFEKIDGFNFPSIRIRSGLTLAYFLNKPNLRELAASYKEAYAGFDWWGQKNGIDMFIEYLDEN